MANGQGLRFHGGELDAELQPDFVSPIGVRSPARTAREIVDRVSTLRSFSSVTGEAS